MIRPKEDGEGDLAITGDSTNGEEPQPAAADLVFGDQAAEGAILTEEEFERCVRDVARRIKSLEPIVAATKERMGLSPDWIQAVARERQSKDTDLAFGGRTRGRGRDRDTQAPVPGAGDASGGENEDREEDVEDEDLMTGLTSTSA